MKIRTVTGISALFIIICGLIYPTTWAAKSKAELVKEFPIIVTGRIVELDDEGTSATAHLAVEEVLKNRTEADLKPGMFITFRTTSPTSKFSPPGMSGYTKGQEGIWFLKYDSGKKAYRVSYPYSLKPEKEKREIEKLIAALPPLKKPVPQLSIAVAIPKTGINRYISCRKDNDHFHVVLTNNSDKPLNLWQEGNSWGYSSLSFIIEDNTGKEHIMKKKMKSWRKNIPSTLTLDPGEMRVINVKYHGEEWEGAVYPQHAPGVKLRRSRRPEMRIKAVYEIKQDMFTKQHKVWTGRIESEQVKTAVFR